MLKQSLACSLFSHSDWKRRYEKYMLTWVGHDVLPFGQMLYLIGNPPSSLPSYSRLVISCVVFASNALYWGRQRDKLKFRFRFTIRGMSIACSSLRNWYTSTHVRVAGTRFSYKTENLRNG